MRRHSKPYRRQHAWRVLPSEWYGCASFRRCVAVSKQELGRERIPTCSTSRRLVVVPTCRRRDPTVVLLMMMMMKVVGRRAAAAVPTSYAAR